MAMVVGSSVGSKLLGLSGVPRQRGHSDPGCLDRFEAGAEVSTLSQRPQFAPAQVSASWGDSLKKMASTGVLALATVAAIGGLIGPAVCAAQDLPVANVSVVAPETLSALQASPERLAALQSVPGSIMERYQELTPNLKDTLYRQLKGSTFGVSHRDAFVKGRAMGMDAFQVMGEKLDSLAQQGKLTGEEASALKTDLQKIKQLTPQQRDAIAEVILLQKGQ